MNHDTTPDPTNITEPVMFDGALVFPASWSADDRSEFIALAEELAAEQDALHEARGEALAPTGAAAINAAKRAEIDKIRADRLAAEQAKRDADDLATLESKYGKGRVGRIPTVDGVFYLRPMAEAEIDRSEARAAGLTKIEEKLNAAKQATLGTVVHPTTPDKEARAKAATHLASYPGDWGAFFGERDRIITGLRDDLGKGA